MKNHEKYIQTREVVERVRLVGPASESDSVTASLVAARFRITQAGPYSDREMYPAVDLTRFLFIAERQIDDP